MNLGYAGPDTDANKLVVRMRANARQVNEVMELKDELRELVKRVRLKPVQEYINDVISAEIGNGVFREYARRAHYVIETLVTSAVGIVSDRYIDFLEEVPRSELPSRLQVNIDGTQILVCNFRKAAKDKHQVSEAILQMNSRYNSVSNLLRRLNRKVGFHVQSNSNKIGQLREKVFAINRNKRDGKEGLKIQK